MILRHEQEVASVEESQPQSTRDDFPPRDPQLFYELSRDRLAAQLSHIDAVDNKIGLLLSLASALMVILAGVFALRVNVFGAAEYTTLAASALVYTITSLYALRAYWARSWWLGPSLLSIWNRLWDTEEDDQLAKWKTANDYRGYYERNRFAQKTKESALPWVLAGVVIQSLCLVLALSLVAAGV